LDTFNQISLLDVDLVRLITLGFSRDRGRYVYEGSKKLQLSDTDKAEILAPKTISYREFRVDTTDEKPRRRHYERIHQKFQTPELKFPEINLYNPNNKPDAEPARVTPISVYGHDKGSSTISYQFDKNFIAHNNEFKSGYRDVCYDVLDRLSGRYSRFFFVYLSGDKYNFRFSVEKIRNILNLNDKYKKHNTIKLILNGVKEQLAKIDINFDFAYCTEAEWTQHTQETDNRHEQPTENNTLFPEKKNRKKLRRYKFTKSFYFRAKGMDKYRIPKAMTSKFSRDIANNTELAAVQNFLTTEIRMAPSYLATGGWEYIVRYVKQWGAKNFMDFAAMKMKQMAQQKTKPKKPHSVLMDLIQKKVKELDRAGYEKTGMPLALGKVVEKTVEAIAEKTQGGLCEVGEKTLDGLDQLFKGKPPDSS
jgi:hypothetical protein